MPRSISANLARSLIQHAEDTFELAGCQHSRRRRPPGNRRRARPRRMRNCRSFLNGAQGRPRPHPAAVRHCRRERRLARVVAGAIWRNRTSAIANTFRHHQQSTDRAMFIGRPVQQPESGEQWVDDAVSRRFNHPDGSVCRRRDCNHRRPVFLRNSTASSISARAAPSRLSRTDGIDSGAHPRQR